MRYQYWLPVQKKKKLKKGRKKVERERERALSAETYTKENPTFKYRYNIVQDGISIQTKSSSSCISVILQI